MKSRIDEERKTIAGYAKNTVCDKGDFDSYYEIVKDITRLEREQKSSKRDKTRQNRSDLSGQLNPGSVIRVKTAGKYQSGLITKIMRERRGQDSYWIVLENGDGKKFHLNEIDPVAGVISELVINRTMDFSKRESRKQIAKVLASIGYKKPDKNEKDARSSMSIDELRRDIRKHPCHSCSYLYEHLRWAERKDKLIRSVNSLELNFNN